MSLTSLLFTLAIA